VTWTRFCSGLEARLRWDIGGLVLPVHAGLRGKYVTRQSKLVIDDPDIRQRLIKAIESYSAICREGCTTDLASWNAIDNNKTFLTTGS
jgi:hypothetical protein